MPRGRNGNGHNGGAVTVNGHRTEVEPEETQEDRQQRLLMVSDETLVREIAEKRADIKEAKSAHGVTGQRVAKLNGELEDYLKEIDRREELRKAAADEKQITLT